MEKDEQFTEKRGGKTNGDASGSSLTFDKHDRLCVRKQNNPMSSD